MFYLLTVNLIIDLLRENWLPVNDGELGAPDVTAVDDDFFQVADCVVPHQPLVNPILYTCNAFQLSSQQFWSFQM